MTAVLPLWRKAWSRSWLVVALVAVAMKVLVPPGFMVASPDSSVQLAVPLVICTGHGPATSERESDHRAPPHKSASEGTCLFAGHGLAAEAPLAPPIARAFASAKTTPPLTPADLAPGRGLAAPPPPVRGPPGQVI
jgi:hypothetical protein